MGSLLDTESYRLFFERTNQPMYVSSLEGYFQNVNQALARLLGRSREELIGEPVESVLYDPQERKRFRQAVEARGTISDFAILLKGSSGEPLACLVDAVVIVDDAGQVLGYAGMIQSAEHGSEVADDDFRVALKSSQDGLWEWDVRRGQAHFSPRWKAMLGYGSDELRPSLQEWLDRVHPDDLPDVMRALNRFLVGDEVQFSSYHRVRHRNGEYLWMMVLGKGEFDPAGRCVRLGGSFTNVSAQLKLFEKWRAKESQLELKNAVLAQEREVLSQYFSRDMLDQIFNQGLNPCMRDTVLLQIAIEGFEGDSWPPARLAELWDEVLTDLMDQVYAHGGTVSKIWGQALLCAFYDEQNVDEALRRAWDCVAALKIWRDQYNQVKPKGVDRPLHLYLGLARGSVLWASLGSVHRRELTLVGPAVLRADRLQRKARRRGRFLCSQKGLHPVAARKG